MNYGEMFKLLEASSILHSYLFSKTAKALQPGNFETRPELRDTLDQAQIVYKPGKLHVEKKSLRDPGRLSDLKKLKLYRSTFLPFFRKNPPKPIWAVI